MILKQNIHMSQYWNKTSTGIPPSIEDWNHYLLEAHSKAPSMTPKAFENPKNAEGKNSYTVLVKAASQLAHNTPKKVIDIACGDGHLTSYIRQIFGVETEIVGIDMSESELQLAKQNHVDSRIRYKNESADSISEPNDSFDIAFCHMALMLISPLTPALNEAVRILKPGGIFAGVVSSNETPTGFLQIYRQLFSSFVKSHFSKYETFSIGDPLTGSISGLNTLLNKHFYQVSVTPLDLIVSTTPEETWLFFKDMYRTSLMPKLYIEKFRLLVIREAEKAVDAKSNKLSFTFPLNLFTAKKQLQPTY